MAKLYSSMTTEATCTSQERFSVEKGWYLNHAIDVNVLVLFNINKQ